MKRLKIISALALAGTLFAGYLSGFKLATGQCALNEPCPLFLGYPACWYGFGLFILMFIISAIAIAGKISSRKAILSISVISVIGIIFAGSFVWSDVTIWIQSGQKYALILPSCVYGLIFYIAIFWISFIELRKIRSDRVEMY